MENANKVIIAAPPVESMRGYAEWFDSVKLRFAASRLQTALKINEELLRFYWQLGKEIVELKAEERWGSGVIERMSLDFKTAFPHQRGFSTTNLWYIKKWYLFYSEYCQDEKLPQPVGELQRLLFGTPWGHHRTIITKCPNVEHALFYLHETVENNWSRAALEDAIEGDFYSRKGKAVTNFTGNLPSPQGGLAQSILKSPYRFNFLSMEPGYDEHDLENALTFHITQFLLELGKGFSFCGRQVEVVVSGTSYFIDMLFYHIRLKCYVVVELKVTDFIPEYAGKLNFYVTAVDRLLKAPDDNPSIGLLICRTKDNTKVEWALDGFQKPLGVASYKVPISTELQNALPSAEELKAAVNLNTRNP